jgi:hypothetical protein
VRTKSSHSILCLSFFGLSKVDLDCREISAAASERMAEDSDDMTSEARDKPAYGRGKSG